MALVCRRLRAAANSAAALDHLSVRVGNAGAPSSIPAAHFLGQLRSLCHFVLHVAAQHLQRLHLDVHPPASLDAGDWAEAGLLIGSLVQACSNLKRLTFELHGGFKWTLSPWASSLTMLRVLVSACGCAVARVVIRLPCSLSMCVLLIFRRPLGCWPFAQVLHSRGVLHVSGDLRALSALQELTLLSGQRVVVEPTCLLPTSMTALALENAHPLPSQVRPPPPGTLSSPCVRLTEVQCRTFCVALKWRRVCELAAGFAALCPVAARRHTGVLGRWAPSAVCRHLRNPVHLLSRRCHPLQTCKCCASAE